MRHLRGSYLSTRPAFLLSLRLPYDGLAQCPEKLAGSPWEGVWMCFPKY